VLGEFLELIYGEKKCPIVQIKPQTARQIIRFKQNVQRKKKEGKEKRKDDERCLKSPKFDKIK
jgi:hypothetical protein